MRTRFYIIVVRDDCPFSSKETSRVHITSSIFIHLVLTDGDVEYSAGDE